MQEDAYKKLARKYDRQVEPAASRLRQAGLRICPPKDNERILDVGCGTGSQLAAYLRPGCKLTGIDVSPAMLEMARLKLGTNAELLLESGAKMSFADCVFDLVTVVLALHEMASEIRLQVLKECRRVLKPDGRILLVDFHYGPYPFPMGWIWKLFVLFMEAGAGREHFAHYTDFMSRRGLDSLVKELGLSIQKRWVAPNGNAAIYLLSR